MSETRSRVPTAPGRMSLLPAEYMQDPRRSGDVSHKRCFGSFMVPDLGDLSTRIPTHFLSGSSDSISRQAGGQLVPSQTG